MSGCVECGRDVEGEDGPFMYCVPCAVLAERRAIRDALLKCTVKEDAEALFAPGGRFEIPEEEVE